MLKIANQYRVYIHFDKYDETYELIMPMISAHNLVIGTMYIDIGETMTVINTKNPNQICEINFQRRGWFSQEAFKFTGQTFTKEGNKKLLSHTIEGNWNKDCKLID